jgi:parallel beta-helix repeat protein
MSDSTEPTANILIDTTNGSVREGAIVGCTIQHTHNAPNSANVRFIGTGREIANKVGHFCISDNAMSDVAVNIHLQYARGVIITGNTLWKGFTHNLLVEGSSNIVVGPNLFDRNPDYGPKGSTNALVFRNCHDCTLNGLHINNVMETPAGLMLKNCSWINVTGCTILDCDNVGLSLQNCDHCRVSDCIVRDTRTGVTNPVAISVTGGRENQLGQNLTVGQRKIELESLKAGNSSTSQ